MHRRRFLDWLSRVIGVALAGFVAYPIFRYLVPPKKPEAATRRVIAAKKDELAPGDFKIFPFGGQPGILVRTSEGEYRAFTGTCTHLACTVQYRKERKDIWCACHDGIYDMSGGNVAGPPPRPLERYEVHEVGDDLVVEKAQKA